MGAQVSRAKLQHCSFDTNDRAGLSIPGCKALPDAVLVRTMDAGSFEQVTRRLGLLHAMRELGVTVWNDARAIERCVDKSMTSFLLAQAGIPTPPTWTIEREKDARARIAAELRHGPVVLKPLFGSQGRGLRLVKSLDDMPPADALGHVYYIQRFVAAGTADYEDYRVFVTGGRAVAAMRRSSRKWLTHVKQGGKPSGAVLDEEVNALATSAAQATGADFCGVDVIRPRLGRSLVLEVNSMPAWGGLQQVTPINIAQEIAASLMKALRAKIGLRAAAG
jgi:RimK family alpha-L-glutamate ligase